MLVKGSFIGMSKGVTEIVSQSRSKRSDELVPEIPHSYSVALSAPETRKMSHQQMNKYSVSSKFHRM
jgi:hypothetical protein